MQPAPQAKEASAWTADTCTLRPTPAAAVSRVIDGETLELADGTTVRLIGALAPRGWFSDRPWRVEQDSVASLTALVQGKPLQIAADPRSADRHGRTLAHVFVERDGERIWVQGERLREGQARAYNLPSHATCFTELLAHEDAARRAKRGLWAGRAFRPRDATLGRDLLKYRNSFQIVQGKVLGVDTVRDWTYLNFGSDRHSDFTAGLRAEGSNEPGIAAELNSLKGEPVEVRGWIEWRGGPFIEIWDRRQIKRLDAGIAPAAASFSNSMDSSER